MPNAAKFVKTIAVPEDVELKVEATSVTVKGPKGALTRTFECPRLSIETANGNVSVISHLPRKQDKALCGTIIAHIANMIKGVTAGFTYEMKIVYSHFPMKAIVKGSSVVIENFLGERHPRHAKIVGDTKVEVKGDTVTLSGINNESVGQTAANIEIATRIRRFDPRVFQDGIYIVRKERQ